MTTPAGLIAQVRALLLPLEDHVPTVFLRLDLERVLRAHTRPCEGPHEAGLVFAEVGAAICRRCSAVIPAPTPAP